MNKSYVLGAFEYEKSYRRLIRKRATYFFLYLSVGLVVCAVFFYIMLKLLLKAVIKLKTTPVQESSKKITVLLNYINSMEKPSLELQGLLAFMSVECFL